MMLRSEPTSSPDFHVLSASGRGIVNPFFSPAIEIHSKGGHRVITRGPYRFLRHPNYLAMLIAMPASAFAVGSRLALIRAAGFGVDLLRRRNWRTTSRGKICHVIWSIWNDCLRVYFHA